MAGTGRVTARLVESGVHPTCVDFSQHMLARLTKKLGIESPMIVCADVRALPFASAFKLAILPYNSFSELVSEEDRHAALRSIRAALGPGARFICTLYNPAFRLRSVNSEPRIVAEFSSPSGSGEVAVTEQLDFDADRGVVSGMETLTTRVAGEVAEEISIPVEFCLPSRSWFAAASRSTGFTVEALFGDYDQSQYDEKKSRFMVWCLRKGAA
jgi:SAM-dependent methyltransferase